MTEATLARLPAAGGPILDLFAGVGTLSLPLAARGWRVHAVEGDASAVGALSAAAQAASIPLTTETRDLARDPMAAEALRRVRAVVFDPPRAGARAQAALIASDGPDDVVAVSCNPATFARDARLLVDGGYRLESVTPIDQFPWSAHVELVAGFRRANT
jgi:23S rRNA (uracil1939-C5)-methyltransferase